MGRHAKPRRLGAGQLAAIAVAGAVVAGAAGAGIVRMAGGGTEPFEPASSAVAAATAPPTAAPTARAAAAGGGPVGALGVTGSPASPAYDPPRSAIATVSGDRGELVSTRVVAGSATRTLSGLRPVRWFADGTLLLQDSDGRAETVVYDPVAGRFLARVPYVYGVRGLPAAPGPGAAPLSFFVPEDLIAAPTAPLDRPPGGSPRATRHNRTLIEVSTALAERRTQLPAGSPVRTYRPGAAVRVGSSVFVPYGQGTPGPRGVLRIGPSGTTKILEGARIERLAVSSDYRHLPALARTAGAPALGAATVAGGDDLTTLRILAVDPDSGEVTRRLRLPAKPGRKPARVGLIDRVGSRYAVQLARACPAGARPACAVRGTGTWRWLDGRWTRVAGSTGAVILWQSADAAVVWRLPAGKVEFLRDGRRRQLHAQSAPGVFAAPGALLRPHA